MKRISISLLATIAFLLCSNTAQSAINECSSKLCPVVYKNSGHVVFYDLSDAEKGSVPFANGDEAYVCAKDGLVVVNENLTDTALLYKVANGTFQIAAIGADSSNTTVFNGHAWIGGWTSYIYKANPDTGAVNQITIGGAFGPWSIASNDNFAFTMNAAVASITEIDVTDTLDGPYAMTGYLPADQFEGLIWDEDDQVLYATIANNVAKITPGSPNYTVTDYLASDLAEKPTLITSDATHIVVEAVNNIYIIPKGATPVALGNVITRPVSSVRDVAICGNYVYAASGAGVEKFNKSGTSLGMLTTDNSWGIACVKPTCGNNVVDIGEQCDFGDTTPGDGCDAACQIETGPVCGNSAVETGEDCDDGPANSNTTPDACREDCSNPGCGDDVTDSGEQCDDGTSNSDTQPDACRTDCSDPICGDAVIDTGEECDGINLGTATCVSLGYASGTLSCNSCGFNTSQCVPPVTCGNGVPDPGEECDNGAANSNTEPDACRTNCTNPTCGDNVTDTGEQCDDNNLVAGDGCDENCNIESLDCGNDEIDTDEDCDGSNLDGQTCVGLGFTGGDLTCANHCRFDTSACTEAPVCDPDGRVKILDELPTDFTFDQYSQLKHEGAVSQYPNTECTLSCVEIAGKVGVRVETSSRCIFRVDNIHNQTGWAVLELWQIEEGVPAVWIIDPYNTENWTPYSGAWVFDHEGEPISFSFGQAALLHGGTLGTAPYGEITNVGTEDEKMIIVMIESAMWFAYGDKEIILSADGNNQGVFYTNRPLDSPVWNTGGGGGKGCLENMGCSAGGNSGGLPLAFMFIIITFLWRKRGK
ncbi:DUF4215 domain-containing protein [Patescibacteria group bacterium]